MGLGPHRFFGLGLRQAQLLLPVAESLRFLGLALEAVTRAIRRADFQAHLTAAVDQSPIDWQSYAQAPLNPLLLPTD